MNELYNSMGEAQPEEMDALMDEAAVLQELLNAHDFYMIDNKVEDITYKLSEEDFKEGYAILRKGKKVYHKVIIK